MRAQNYQQGFNLDKYTVGRSIGQSKGNKFILFIFVTMLLLMSLFIDKIITCASVAITFFFSLYFALILCTAAIIYKTIMENRIMKSDKVYYAMVKEKKKISLNNNSNYYALICTSDLTHQTLVFSILSYEFGEVQIGARLQFKHDDNLAICFV